MSKTAGAFSPPIAVSRKAAKPLHRQIYEACRAAILSGRLQAGQQVPSTRALAAELRVSRIPVLTAYAQLLAEGYFESRTGAGTFVSNSLPDQMTSCQAGRTKANGKTSSGPRVVSRLSAALPAHESARWMYRSGAFSVGQLAFDHFPFQVWSNLVVRHARKVRASSLNYGEPLGSRQFRETIAAYLRTARAVECNAGQIMVVSGSQQALDLSARVLLDPGSPVWIEDPGYEWMRHALTLAGAHLVPVPVDDEGMHIAAGIQLCRKARAAYVTPSHQYPLGVTMSAARRMQLLDWAQHAGSWIVEDDYDSEYRYGSMPIASLQGLDSGSRVIYIGTFSKTLFPSLRLGYMVIPPDLVDRFVAVRMATDLCPPRLSQAVLADFITEGHYARHIRRTRLVYGERRDALVSALRKEFSSGLQIVGGEAGMHLAVILPAGLNDRDIARRAAAAHLWLWPLSPAYQGKAARHGFILGFGSIQAADMPQAVRRLREVLAAEPGWPGSYLDSRREIE
ncbi:MAG TPA: PLP-dependent aminotransferase family protein [Bryobacteraceae bacterium]|nr:PLP-dependent aminotransferase family protein [Bryobacteraceae bacterium]